MIESQRVAYTPRPEFQCGWSETSIHYQGCQCHEAAWSARVEDLQRDNAAARDKQLELMNELRAAMDALDQIGSWCEHATDSIDELCECSTRMSIQANQTSNRLDAFLKEF